MCNNGKENLRTVESASLVNRASAVCNHVNCQMHPSIRILLTDPQIPLVHGIYTISRETTILHLHSWGQHNTEVAFPPLLEYRYLSTALVFPVPLPDSTKGSVCSSPWF